MLWTSDIKQLRGQAQNCRSLTGAFFDLHRLAVVGFTFFRGAPLWFALRGLTKKNRRVTMFQTAGIKAFRLQEQLFIVERQGHHGTVHQGTSFAVRSGVGVTLYSYTMLYTLFFPMLP